MSQGLIALVGVPKSGKTTVQEMLRIMWGVQPVDDGRVLRDIAKQMFNLTEEQVTTQEGKASVIEIDGKKWVVRNLLGEIGNKLEELFGPFAMPLAALNSIKGRHGLFSFGSVRREQPRFYRENGGHVIEVIHPRAQPTGN